MPLASKILIVGVLLSIISASTPHWVHVTSLDGKATFGLWHFCKDKVCTSIHDNLVPGRDVPGMYNLTTMNEFNYN